MYSGVRALNMKFFRRVYYFLATLTLLSFALAIFLIHSHAQEENIDILPNKHAIEKQDKLRVLDVNISRVEKEPRHEYEAEEAADLRFRLKPLDGVERVIYNRVPKCASTALRLLFKEVCEDTGCNCVSSKVHGREVLNKTMQRAFVEDVMSQETPSIYVRHVHMVNFTRFGVERAPVHINVIRNPLSRLASDFYFKRNNIQGMYKVANVSSFDHCVRQGIPECVDPSTKGFFKIIPYFCGQESYCRKATPEALATAKRNVLSSYALVGIMEELDHFILLLEHLLPSYFEGLYDRYRETEIDLKSHFGTKNKVAPSGTTRRTMRQLMGLEYDFYFFIKQRFYTTFVNFKEMHDLEAIK